MRENTTYYDDSQVKRTYTNGILTSQSDFEYYREKYTDIKGRKMTIEDPTIIVEIDAERPNFKADLFTQIGVIMKGTGAYEYKKTTAY